MLFNSITFAIFFLIVVIVFYLLPGKIKRWWLLSASFYFYMHWNPRYIFLMLFSIITTYIGGRCLEQSDTWKFRGGTERLLLVW